MKYQKHYTLRILIRMELSFIGINQKTNDLRIIMVP
jgi:hypothetical protein